MNWRDKAACSEYPKDWWYVERGSENMRSNIAQARAICDGCPVASECLQYAMEHNETHGMWGGKSVRERRKLLNGWVVVRHCKHCNTEIRVTLGRTNGQGNTRYCSNSCRQAAYRSTNTEQTGTPCLWCAEISSGHSHTTPGYCSWVCERSARRARLNKLMAAS